MTIERLDLWEHRVLPDLVLPPALVAAISRSEALDLRPSTLSADRWELRARQYVGVLRLGTTEVRIHPKVPVGNLLFMLAYAHDQRGWREISASFDASTDLVTAIAMGLAYHAERALEQGVLQGYVSREEALSTVRGRIRTGDQMRRRFGLPLPVELTYDEFTPDIYENRILFSAIRRLQGIPGLPSLVIPRLRHLQAKLEGVGPLEPGRPLPTILYTRLNQRYRSAIALGSLILRGMSFAFRDGSVAASGFLFDMNRVFEDFLSVALAPLFAERGLTLKAQHKDQLDEGATIDLRPDLTWWLHGRCLGVADAKYKSLVSQDLPNPDVYQTLSYCIALRQPVGHLIYAEGNEPKTTHIIRNMGTVIRVLTVDLGKRPSELLNEMKLLCGQLVGDLLVEAVGP